MPTLPATTSAVRSCCPTSGWSATRRGLRPVPFGPAAGPTSRCRSASATRRDERARTGHGRVRQPGGSDPDVLDTWFSSAALAPQHPGLARSRDRRSRTRGRARWPRRATPPTASIVLLPRLLPGHRPRHHHPVGGAHGGHGAVQPRRRAVHRRVHPRQHPGRQGRADEQVARQRHRPGRHDRPLRRRRAALRAMRDADRHPGRAAAGSRRLAVYRQHHRPRHGEARPHDLLVSVPRVGQGVRRPRHARRRPRGQAVQRAFRGGAQLLQQAVELGAFCLHQPDRVRRIEPRQRSELCLEDRWVLSRLAATRDEVHRQLEQLQPVRCPVGGARVLLGGVLRLVPRDHQATDAR